MGFPLEWVPSSRIVASQGGLWRQIFALPRGREKVLESFSAAFLAKLNRKPEDLSPQLARFLKKM